MNDPAPSATPAVPPRAISRAAPDPVARSLAALALVTTLVAAWVAVEARQGVHEIESSAGGRIAELGSESSHARASLIQVQAALKEAQGRISELEARVADTQQQRVALEQIYRDLARSADDRVLAEVEQMLVLASQQLQLAGNVRGALAALQAADQRLARADKLAATPLRRAITHDMDRLKAAPQVDTVGIAVKLDALINEADALPLVIAQSAPLPRYATHWRNTEERGFTRAARDFWDEMKGLVKIRDMETTDLALLSPAQSYFLRENLKLRLLSARVALLARDEPSFREDVRATQAWVARYFDPHAKATIAALATLKQVAASPVEITPPDINASLAAVRTARAAGEKP